MIASERLVRPSPQLVIAGGNPMVAVVSSDHREDLMASLLRVATIVSSALALTISSGRGAQSDDGFTRRFPLDANELTSTGRNPYFVLEPGYRLELEDKAVHLTITVLPETKTVDGVETRVVEERETNAGQLVEVSRNYFAISRRTNSVFYFGEDVDIYKNGTVASHEGGWLAGVSAARFGLMMPGLPLLSARYYQELAPKVAMDRARITAVSGTLTTAAGTFSSVLEIEETTPLEPGHREFKRYAPGVGLIQDGSFKLVRHSQAERTR
jgi:hypothetical protein